jgi:PAS domain S-box-containing protein
MPIRTKAVLILLTLSLVPLAAIGWLACTSGEESIRHNLGSSFQRLAREAIDQVDRDLHGVYRNVQTWAQLDVMQEVLTGDVDARISSFLVRLGREYGYFSSLVALNRKGEAVASNDPALIGREMRQEDCHQAMAGKASVGDVHLDPVQQAWVVTFAFPIEAHFEAGQVVGVLCARWRADELAAMTQPARGTEARAHGQLMVLRGDGLLISAPEGMRQEIFRRNILEEGLRSARLVTQHASGYLVERDAHGQSWLIGYDSSKGYRDFPGLGWAALVAQDAKSAFAPIERLKLVVTGLGAAVALCVIVISLVLARRVTTPILQIARVAGRVAQGDFDVQISLPSHDEIGSLANAFNQMTQDLKRQRAQLVEKEYVENIIHSMINTLMVADLNATIKTVNRATCDLLGYKAEELIGQPVALVVGEDELPLTGSGSGGFIEHHALTNVEKTYLAKDGKKIPMLFSSSVLRNHGTPQGIVCVAQDITELKHIEDALRQQAAELVRSNAELEQFAYIASHDLQEPLRMVASYVQLLVRRYSDRLDGNAKEFIAYAVGGVTRMQRLINDLLEYSRVGTRGKPLGLADCEVVLDEVLANLKVTIAESGAVVTRQPLPTVRADATQLRHLFQNLLANAIKFRKPDEPPRVHISAERAEQAWTFAIRDNGIGIDPQYHERIFVIFQRLHTEREYPGTGIGLAICKKIVERHGGKIWVESKPGQGAAFLFTLPAGQDRGTG